MANRQYFRIEGEAVHLVSEQIQRTVKLSDLLAEVGKEAGIITPVLPQGWRLLIDRPIVFHSSGYCSGGEITVAVGGTRFDFRLEAPFCQLAALE